ncbi:MAG: glycosyltransferase family 87 protein [Chlamydiota bacterium]
MGHAAEPMRGNSEPEAQQGKKADRKRFRDAALVAIACALLLVALNTTRAPLHNDFVEYWAAAHVLLAGGNPYSPSTMLAVEAATGRADKRPLLMWNPPWTLPFILPFGVLSYNWASAVWLLLNLVTVFACGDFLWRQYAGDPRRRWLGWLLAASFFPLLTALGLGQIGPLILLGLTLFLRYQTKRPLLAGAATILIALKPQLLYLFWVALLLENLQRPRWKLVAGVALAFLTATALPLLLNPKLLHQYLQLAAGGAVLSNPSPAFGTLLRMRWGDHAWLQFVPSFLGLGWAVIFWWTRRREWNWPGYLPLLLLVSLVTTAYGWLFDQVVLLPALMQLAVPLARSARRLQLQTLIGYTGISALMVAFVLIRKTGTAYTWTAPAWLVLYLWVRRGTATQGAPLGIN